jgi:hypothetical protein
VLGVAVGVFGTSFGVLSTTAGLSVAQTCVMSLVVFTGASRFAVAGILASGGSVPDPPGGDSCRWPACCRPHSYPRSWPSTRSRVTGGWVLDARAVGLAVALVAT